MAMYQSATTANVEFLKSSKGFSGRIIRLNYNAGGIPQQLYGRIDMKNWGAFIHECELLAERHPYVQKPTAKQVGMWGACFALASVIGCASINPDGGSYPHWEAEVQQMLQRWRPIFEHGGMALSLQRTREHWIQIDVVGPPPSGPPQFKEGVQAGKTEQQHPGKVEQGYPDAQKGGWESQQQPGHGQPAPQRHHQGGPSYEQPNSQYQQGQYQPPPYQPQTSTY